jgi:nucleoside-diphosphate-sugar epimerase
MSRVAASLDNVEICTQNNIVGTANLLAAAREAGVAKVVYSASSTHYGNQKPPHIEEMRPEFLNFYCLSKYVGEEYCLLYDRTYDLPVVALRYFNVYGPRQPETGVYALVLGIFLRQWAQGQSLTIHGDGSQRRDFVHVKDVIAANVKAFRSDVRGQAFNVGSGTNISIKELADLISDNQSFGPRRPGDAEETLADITKIAASLHWKPQVSMTDGIEEMKALVASNVSGKS